MMDYRTSDIFQQLVRQGLAEQTAGTVGMAGMKSAGGSYGSAAPQGLADAMGGDPAPAYELREGDHRSPIRLIWTNLKQPAVRYVASSLKLVK